MSERAQALLDMFSQHTKPSTLKTEAFQNEDGTFVMHFSDYFHKNPRCVLLDRLAIDKAHFDNGYVPSAIYHLAAKDMATYKASFGE